MPTTYQIVGIKGSSSMRDVSARRESMNGVRRESAAGNDHTRRARSVPRLERTMSPRRESTAIRLDGSDKSRSKRSLEPSPPSNLQLMLHDDIDGPWQRAKDEWKDSHSWFAIDDCGRLLDVPHSFGSKKTVYKWIFFGWMLATMIYLWSTAENAWFMGNLDHWALLASMIYQTLSLGNAHFPPPQPAVADGVNSYVKAFWIIFEVAAHLQLLATFMFWVVVYPQEHNNLPINYGMFALHGLVLIVVWIDGMLLNRIPVRIKHYFFVLVVDTLYILWTIIQAAARVGPTTVTVVDTSRTDPDAVYIALDWSNDTVQTIFLMIAMLTVFAPILFLFQYCMSLYSFPWTWNGSKSRRCIALDMCTSSNISSSRQRQSTSAPTNVGRTHVASPAPAPSSIPPKKTKKPLQPPQGQPQQQQKPKTSINSETSRSTRADQTLPLEISPPKRQPRSRRKPSGILSSGKSTDASVLTCDFDEDIVLPAAPKASKKPKKKQAPKAQPAKPKPKRQKSLKSVKSLLDIA